MEDLTHAPLSPESAEESHDEHCCTRYFHPVLTPFKRLNSRLMIKEEDQDC